ncbi:MAG: TatA/E family twin arginine-targeting protein translocase [Brasilonema octagenarum HA4186-MV1]|jgi:sec-independent protein translocase protein TatA|uniref:Sec-independent protein translocase protein TatA n=2 Tax=Brasilonema TaxID=383614 RepID=A0A856MLU2_9CYAN|nr:MULTISPECIES: TatA/E family twin arginine-targeting protein translocase [Brasilonema]MBW4625718.1 TatA/E family twin arginine-targeting protein translocase [Brasilonema octagenarum HA4186-MV1]NMF61723.1 TatA/E family twin arginine-targeting protein translocase [Brasilonema octagenarum UFV-OR1]QDL11349.1 TatA/E family twin arginine-targeting protein translocase [Brasilonema sennae CENA114]QDL17690.1 TatA/E family twin arginine-targeting protein translocase [Brasilonema octagenarum UFV-E1]
MNVFGIGLPEMALIFVVALLIFGPKKLPEVGRSLGKAIRGFQQASSEFQNEFQKEAVELQEAVKTTAELDTKQTTQPETKQIEATKLEQDTASSAQKS